MEEVKTVEKAKAPAKAVGSSFSKEQLLVSERFRNERDIVDALLSPDKTYTVEKVRQMIDTYRKGKVR